MKKNLFVFMLILVVALVSACNSKDEEKGNGEEASSDAVFEKIKKEGTIEVGSTSSGPPFTFLNVATGEIDGFMIDIANYIGEELDLDINVNSIQWTSLIPSMDSGKIDMVAAAMAVTEDRQKVLDFSDFVYTYGETLVVLESNNDIKSLDDLEGVKVGVQEASIYYNGLVEEYPEVDFQTYKTHQDMAKELENGRIDVFFADYPVFKEMIKELPDLQSKTKVIQPEDPIWVAEIAIAIPKGSKEFQENVNKALKKMEEDGVKEQLIEKWDLD